MVRLNTKTSVFNMISVLCFSLALMLTSQLYRSSTPIHHYFSDCNNRTSLSIYVKGKYRKRSNSLNQRLRPEGKRVQSSSLSLSGRWPC